MGVEKKEKSQKSDHFFFQLITINSDELAMNWQLLYI